MKMREVTDDRSARGGVVTGVGEWEVVEQFSSWSVAEGQTKSRFESAILTTRIRIDRGWLVRTFYQFFDGQQMHLTMAMACVPDGNEEWKTGR